MKIRLYRGPANGKVLYVEDNKKEIVVASTVKPRRRKKKLTSYGPTGGYINIPSGTNSTYFTTTATNTFTAFSLGVPVQIPAPSASEFIDIEKSKYVITNCFHPDGSRFFEWEKPIKRAR